ncbi:hypothetical protein L211DRAFT_522851 [Terfezia boudieri ATCC MYA-4762]|uniref:Uncharacterized protein n=1 Tax=Terfezia boudieri ATCC MYA-4762 TaxID=1051890 RepID=A0A3N4LQW0_9PEZI|nr:hypothetical protein L211DRAFT_522851 [Terfezia boudieri ATCC MYA-4762]
METGSCTHAACRCLRGHFDFQIDASTATPMFILSPSCSRCLHRPDEHSRPQAIQAAVEPARPSLLLESTTTLIDSDMGSSAGTAQGLQVTPPPTLRRSKAPNWPGSPSRPDASICPRVTTVYNLYRRVLQHQVLLVRGTPAIGKTTLLKLLYYYLDELPSGPSVFRVNGWTRPRVSASNNWASYILKETQGLDVYDSSLEYVLLLDEAQSSYWDDQFWSEFVKELAQGSWAGTHAYLVLFSSYGSISLPDAVTPPYLVREQTVSLRAEIGEELPVSLLLSREEFGDALERKARKKIKYTLEVEEALYNVTQGHAGALHSLIEAFTSKTADQQTGQATMTTAISASTTITLDILTQFFSDFNTSFESLAQTTWRRGLPSCESLQRDSEATSVLELLVIERHLSTSAIPPAQAATLERCHRAGWIHSVWLGDQRSGGTVYVLPSLLHHWYLSLLLFAPEQLLPPQIPGITTPLHLALAIIKRFRPAQLNLRTSLSIGPGCNPRPNEATFQDEFFRSCHLVTKGKILAAPEFGSGEGRIDFFIPGVKWGFEFLRNGNRLQQHLSRFVKDATPGAYGKWLRSGVMEDYIVLDFRDESMSSTTRTEGLHGAREEGSHNCMDKLYRVVFREQYRWVRVADSVGTVVMDWVRLLEQEGIR